MKRNQIMGMPGKESQLTKQVRANSKKKLKRKQRKIDIKTKNQQNQENWYK